MIKRFTMITIFIVMIFSCRTVERYSSKSLHSKRHPDIDIKVQQNKKEGLRVHITSPWITGARLEGTFLDTTDDYRIIILDTLYFLVNWPGGWTEGRVNAYAELSLDHTDDYFQIEVMEPLTIWQVRTGSIRYYDDFFEGKEAGKLVQNRYNRIESVSRFLLESDLRGMFAHPGIIQKHGPALKKVVKPILFPEMYGFTRAEKKGKLHPAWYTHCKDNTDDQEGFIIGSDIAWRKDYTNRVFPEELRAIRNYGSMWRDYEEASGLLFILYNLDQLMSKLSDAKIVCKIDKNKDMGE